ncbi:orf129b (mitochondrion) [Beta vulgaris subsp. vulgaris]|uniref:Orf129b protein n=1 Tax=Beta vulgaris subsp. vulgaris TaxID=3555 RepID=Q9MFB4_BETVV|nr:orf129b [Beta vulgaris subsp. vulgaris]BAA99336.1 orf129b [Beta vulgaris subsp. vulgaris]
MGLTLYLGMKKGNIACHKSEASKKHLLREGRLASRLIEMRPFGEAKSISGHQTLQLMRRPYGIKGSVYVVTLPAFQRCLEDGPDAAERRPGSGFPTGRGQETAISRHITTYRQHRRDLGRQPDWESEDP